MTPDLKREIERQIRFHRNRRAEEDTRRKESTLDSAEYQRAMTLLNYHDGAIDALEAVVKKWWGN